MTKKHRHSNGRQGNINARTCVKNLAIMKTYYYYILLKIYLNGKKTTCNKRLPYKIVADWELKVVVSRAEPIRIAFDWRG